jgi:electron transfer flavoprotein alpha subunit
MAKNILVFAEQKQGQFRKAAFEAVSEGKRLAEALGTQAVALVVGKGVKDVSGVLGKYGADKVLAADSDIFEYYDPEAYSRAVVNASKEVDPQIILFTASSMGRDLAPNVAAKLETGMASDVIKLEVVDEKLQAVRPVYAGKARITVEFNKEPNVVTLRPKIFEATESGAEVEPETLSPGVEPGDLRAAVKEAIATAGAKMDLTEADVIVSGGRGMKGPENYGILEELAGILNGTVGASRASVDAGWRPHADQVGQTGKTVAPTLYIACGISGAIQHLAGMSSSKCIVAVNKDPDAPIFQVADFGIVGDLFDVVPVLTEELKKVVS